jgi:ubiquinone/menaquinone biosynthesis C-methylase UbiE
MNKRAYKWFYDHIHSVYYDLLMKYCFLPAGGERRCRLKLIESIEFSPEEKILDMCCGTGGATFAIAERAGEGTEIVGIDLSAGQIKRGRERNRFGNIEFTEGNVVETDFREAYFDKVFITHALHEMRKQERLSTLREARRILVEGGQVIVLELDNAESFLLRMFVGLWFFYWLPFNFETPTRREMLKCGLNNELREAGFRSVRKSRKYHGVFQIVEGEK